MSRGNVKKKRDTFRKSVDTRYDMDLMNVVEMREI